MTRAIQSLIVCRRCKGSLEVEGEPCPRCNEHPGTDPESYRGCVCEPTGAVIDLGQHPSFRPAVSDD